ncbi:unnamed protein product [Heligmosomoides polygyrus]|uniref:SHSP domain-containing protein n=1 Tax=Heligmosomoides polygyrus TaxID=6339 RepID=A0A183F559_HELPZ|nr:unnamed protein product [Heligmosomoides polygyrus]
MDLWQAPRVLNSVLYDAMRDLDRAERSVCGDSGYILMQTVDDDKRFAVSLDVSQFRPEELNVHVEGRELTIEGKQEHKTEDSSIHSFRSFVRKWILPENVDLEAVHTALNDKGQLCVEAPKHTGEKSKKRNIPIMAAPSKPSKK